MLDHYGSDFMTIVDEDGTEYELEVLSTLDYNGFTYLAVIPAGSEEPLQELEVSILKSEDDEAGEPMLPRKTSREDHRRPYQNRHRWAGRTYRGDRENHG